MRLSDNGVKREDRQDREERKEDRDIVFNNNSSLRSLRSLRSWRHALALILLLTSIAAAQESSPLRYVPATAYHILPETHNNESGYFSLCEGLDGSIYVGTAKYGANSYLVEFDPRTSKQKIVIDTHKLCGLSDTGYAAQAKIHTRNFVGPSGKLYVGSKQGYPTKEDTEKNVQYPGGYVMTYDPRTGVADNLGMPMAGQGVIDVVADESRGLIYVITCEDQHWMLYDAKSKTYRELGAILTPFAQTIVDRRGVASAITKEFQLAQFNPVSGKVTVRPILLDAQPWTRRNNHSIPAWCIGPDGQSVYLILLNDPTVITMDLTASGEHVAATSRGKLIEGENPDSRSGVSIGPDGNVYALVRIDNRTGYGQQVSPYLHHLTRFDPRTNTCEDLGVLAVKNPDYFAIKGPDGKPKPWTHGFSRLPDGTLTPLHSHMGIAAAQDGSIYATIIYPYTLLKIDPVAPAKPKSAGAAAEYLRFALDSCDRVESNLPAITQIAEEVARRHIAGGLIGVIYNSDRWPGQGISYELHGRAGNLMHFGFDRPFKRDRTQHESANDVAIMGWQRKPDPTDLDLLRSHKARGMFLIGIGPRELPELAEHVKLCDAWLDTQLGVDDRIVEAGSQKFGRGNSLMNLLNGWALMAETVAALTRHGKMPPMWRAFLYRDSRDWMDRYFRKTQFHDDLNVALVPPGHLAAQYLDRIRYLVGRFENTQLAAVDRAAKTIADEHAAGKKTVVAYKGHTLYRTIGEYEDALWATFHGLHHNLDGEVRLYGRNVPEGSLLLRVDYAGMHYADWCIFTARQQNRIIHVTAEIDPVEQPDLKAPNHGDVIASIDMGHAFGDACVALAGYPFPILPPSGVMQTVAYECINVEVLNRIYSK